jgi:ribose/xylose/arabinose/galactoside ABC-type transport system permease subunit
MLSGYGLHATGMELDAIAAVVIGGTLLTGGTGYVIGTLFGVLMLGIIQTLITFDGTLSSWWTKIVIGLLLFAFCLMQRAFESGTGKLKQPRQQRLSARRRKFALPQLRTFLRDVVRSRSTKAAVLPHHSR